LYSSAPKHSILELTIHDKHLAALEAREEKVKFSWTDFE